MFMVQKNQYSENEYTAPSNLYVQYNPYQATNGILQRTRENNFTICMETQNTSNNQSSLEREEWNWRKPSALLHTILQSYSHQDNMVLLQRNVNQWNKIESTEINPHTNGHLTFDKEGKKWRKDNFFNKCC